MAGWGGLEFLRLLPRLLVHLEVCVTGRWAKIKGEVGQKGEGKDQVMREAWVRVDGGEKHEDWSNVEMKQQQNRNDIELH